LDGDVDFQPECVHLLVDLMRKNRRLGAACGRIHPRGSGKINKFFDYFLKRYNDLVSKIRICCWALVTKSY